MLARLMSAFLMMTALPAEAQSEWLTDARNGCRIWEPNAKPGITATWDGPCVDGAAGGQGVFKWFLDGKLGGTYTGGMRGGMLHGRGTYAWPSGARFEGEYRDNVRSGNGLYVWANGDRYEGGYADDKRQGPGMFRWADGTRFEGMWAGGFPNGHGTKITPEGRTYTGNWTNGCFRQGDVRTTAATTAKACGFE